MNKPENYSEDLKIARHVKISMTERSFLLSLGLHDLRLTAIALFECWGACFVRVIMSVSTNRLSLQVPELTWMPLHKWVGEPDYAYAIDWTETINQWVAKGSSWEGSASKKRQFLRIASICSKVPKWENWLVQVYVTPVTLHVVTSWFSSS